MANIQTVGHDKEVGVCHEPDKQPLQKPIPVARAMIFCWEKDDGIYKENGFHVMKLFSEKTSSKIPSDLTQVLHEKVTI